MEICGKRFVVECGTAILCRACYLYAIILRG